VGLFGSEIRVHYLGVVHPTTVCPDPVLRCLDQVVGVVLDAAREEGVLCIRFRVLGSSIR
jgi:hypothetical protein